MTLTDESARTDKQQRDQDAAEHERAAGSTGDQPCADQPLSLRIEALLLASDRPMTEARLGDLLAMAGKGATASIREAIDELNAQYETTGRSFRIERLAGGFQFMTLQQFGPLLARYHTDHLQTRLSQAALETLAIIAYRQPIMRAEIEAIRGVASGEVLRGLLERHLITIVGRAEELGRPMLYGTTREFLKVFGLANLDDLPKVEGLEPGRHPTAASNRTPQAKRDADQPAEVETADQAGRDEPPHED